MMGRISVPGATAVCILCGMAGFAGVRSLHPAADPQPSSTPDNPNARTATIQADSRALLDHLLADRVKHPIDTRPPLIGAKEAYFARIEELRKTLKPAADPAAASRLASQTCPSYNIWDPDEIRAHTEAAATTAVRYIQWLEADPEGAFTGMLTGENRIAAGSYDGMVAWSSGLPTDQVLSRMEAKPKTQSWALTEGLARQLVKSSDATAFSKACQQIPEFYLRSFCQNTIQSWPAERLTDLKSALPDNLSPTDRFSLDQRMKEAGLEKSSPYEHLNRLYDSADAEPILRQYTAGTLDAASASQALAQLAGTPSEKESPVYQDLIQWQLMRQNPADAAGALKDLPPDKRLVKLDDAYTNMVLQRPDDLLALFEAIPSQEDGLRSRAWDALTKAVLPRSDDDYVAWLRALPPGPNRRMAFDSLSRYYGDSSNFRLLKQYAEEGRQQ